jgi:hypothetical protein
VEIRLEQGIKPGTNILWCKAVGLPAVFPWVPLGTGTGRRFREPNSSSIPGPRKQSVDLGYDGRPLADGGSYALR